jgi:hypothetical protein
LGIGLLSAPSPVAAQAQYIVQPVAEMKVKQLPKGELFWRVESFPTLEKAKAAAPPYRWNPDTVSYDGLPSLTAEVAGKAWLFTLGPKGGTTAGGAEVAEIGPVPPLSAPEYLLRVNYGHGPPGAKTPVHTHPGSEAFYVVAGRLGQRTPRGVPFPNTLRRRRSCPPRTLSHEHPCRHSRSARLRQFTGCIADVDRMARIFSGLVRIEHE